MTNWIDSMYYWIGSMSESGLNNRMYSTVLILGLSLNFGQFDKLIASKLLISFPLNLI